MLTGYRTKTLLCMPIKDSSGDVIGVAQVINKLNSDRFTENDEKVSQPFKLNSIYLLLIFKCAVNINFRSIFGRYLHHIYNFVELA